MQIVIMRTDSSSHYKESRGKRPAQTVSFHARRVSPDRRLVRAHLARAEKAVATVRWYVPAALWQVTYERQESLQLIADICFNVVCLLFNVCSFKETSI